MARKASLESAEFLSLVPAGGLGTRLGPLTAERAKPALAVGFDADGNVKRMIDVPLAAIKAIGGAALVTTRFAPETLDFVDSYPYAQTRKEEGAGSPADSLMDELEWLRQSEASTIGIIPGDAYVTPAMLEDMTVKLANSNADAIILATRHLKGHNVRAISKDRLMTTPEKAVDRVADLGIHMMKKAWLLAQLEERQHENWHGDIWDLYGVDQPQADVILHVPEGDPISVDMGTGPAFHAIVSRLNAKHADESGNIAFPGAVIDPFSTETVALPSSSANIPLSRVTVPEGASVNSIDQTLQGFERR